jgi:hypothetical protein
MVGVARPLHHTLTSTDSLNRVGDIFFHADVVMHYSTLSLVQRAVSPDNVTFNRECLESARAALVAHQRCNTQFNVKGNEEFFKGYIHWSILQVSTGVRIKVKLTSDDL